MRTNINEDGASEMAHKMRLVRITGELSIMPNETHSISTLQFTKKCLAAERKESEKIVNYILLLSS